MEVDGDNIVRKYTYRGEEGEVIPLDATHIYVAVKVILAEAFIRHPNVVEVICHEDVEKIERYAFYRCPRLKRVIMPGVKFVGKEAFASCHALTDVNCGKLEIIKEKAFVCCKSLRSINLTSARIVEMMAFNQCIALTDAKFGSKLEKIVGWAFGNCTSLARITVPLRDDIVNEDDIFMECGNLACVDLVEGELTETVAALHFEEWRNDMNEKIDIINHTLPNAPAGGSSRHFNDPGQKARTIRIWIGSVLRQLGRYKAEHRRLLEEDIAPTLLQHILPRDDVAMNNVLPFLELPPYEFE